MSQPLSARFVRWHRWFGWIVALQVLAWVAGGVVFTWLPFKSWVKGEANIMRPGGDLPVGWAHAVAKHLELHPVPPVRAVASSITATGPALRLQHDGSETWVALDGNAFVPPQASDIERFSRLLRKDGRAPAEVRLMTEVPVRAGIVREAAAGNGVWRASFDDALHSRLYFDTDSGALTAVRNDAWVLYDFFWRLHLMDYTDGEDFNHPLVKGSSLLAFGLVLTGLVLAVLALRRVRRRRARKP